MSLFGRTVIPSSFTGSLARSMATATTMVRIPVNLEITSDSICPFCYIGYKRISSAIQQAKEQSLPLDFSLSFAPFLLDPNLPKTPGESKRTRYARRFGPKFEQMEEQMKERGRAEGIEFSYDGPVSATQDNHRMILKARQIGGEDAQKKYVERVFKTYFEEEGDPGLFELLSRDAETVGIMSKQEALDFLKSDELKKEVEEGILRAQMRGISGVPFTIINGKLAISGAQETETFLDVFKQIASGELKA